MPEKQFSFEKLKTKVQKQMQYTHFIDSNVKKIIIFMNEHNNHNHKHNNKSLRFNILK